MKELHASRCWPRPPHPDELGNDGQTCRAPLALGTFSCLLRQDDHSACQLIWVFLWISVQPLNQLASIILIFLKQCCWWTCLEILFCRPDVSDLAHPDDAALVMLMSCCQRLLETKIGRINNSVLGFSHAATKPCHTVDLEPSPCSANNSSLILFESGLGDSLFVWLPLALFFPRSSARRRCGLRRLRGSGHRSGNPTCLSTEWPGKHQAHWWYILPKPERQTVARHRWPGTNWKTFNNVERTRVQHVPFQCDLSHEVVARVGHETSVAARAYTGLKTTNAETV